MAIYLISYDLHGESAESEEYKKLIRTIEGLSKGAPACHLQYSAWLVSYPGELVDIYNKLIAPLPVKGELFICEVTKDHMHFILDKKVKKWAEAHLPPK